ncbi:hypothetical protein ACLKA6_000335 [Drosophila palustris]
MYNDGGPPTSETQSTGFNSGQNEAQTSCPQHQEQVQETSSRVSCENCTVNPEDPRIKGNSWHRYNDESQRATSGCNATESQAASNFVQLPQSPHTWPVNQPSGSGYPNPPRTYGSPILERQQRPTILVIVVNKPGNRNGVYPQRGYHNGIYNPTANYPIGGYQEGGYNSYSDATGGSPPNGYVHNFNHLQTSLKFRFQNDQQYKLKTMITIMAKTRTHQVEPTLPPMNRKTEKDLILGKIVSRAVTVVPAHEMINSIMGMYLLQP